MSRIGRLSSIVVDVKDPDLVAGFWSAVLDIRLAEREPGRYVDLQPASAGGPGLSFVAVPEGKTVKNRLHLDVEVDDLAVATKRAKAFGATEHGEILGDKNPWRVMLDPEGNELCLVQKAS